MKFFCVYAFHPLKSGGIKIQVPPEAARGQLAPDTLAVRQQAGAGTEGQIRCHHRPHTRAGPGERRMPAESDEGPPRQKW